MKQDSHPKQYPANKIDAIKKYIEVGMYVPIKIPNSDEKIKYFVRDSDMINDLFATIEISLYKRKNFLIEDIELEAQHYPKVESDFYLSKIKEFSPQLLEFELYALYENPNARSYIVGVTTDQISDELIYQYYYGTNSNAFLEIRNLPHIENFYRMIELKEVIDYCKDKINELHDIPPENFKLLVPQKILIYEFLSSQYNLPQYTSKRRIDKVNYHKFKGVFLGEKEDTIKKAYERLQNNKGFEFTNEGPKVRLDTGLKGRAKEDLKAILPYFKDIQEEKIVEHIQSLLDN